MLCNVDCLKHVYFQNAEDVFDVAKNDVSDGNEETFVMHAKVPEIWDPNFKVSTWDHSILGINYSCI